MPFEEDEKDPSVWFLDHNYVESMNDMFKKVNAREKLIGWYHTGPKLRASDLEVNELFKRYTPNPLLVIIDVQPKEVGVPTDAYFAVEEIKDVSITGLQARPQEWSRPSCLSCCALLIHSVGRHNDLQDLCPHTLNNRSRRGRRDRCRTSPPRYPRRCRRHSLHTHNLTTAIAARPTSAVKRHRTISAESVGRGSTREPCDSRQLARRLQSASQPLYTKGRATWCRGKWRRPSRCHRQQ